MLENLLAPAPMQLETSLSPGITTRPEGSTGERKSKLPIPGYLKMVILFILGST